MARRSAGAENAREHDGHGRRDPAILRAHQIAHYANAAVLGMVEILPILLLESASALGECPFRGAVERHQHRRGEITE